MSISLTDEQKIILDRSNENIYVSASPGSGKSTMLSYIAEKLLQNENNFVLLVTFTNKAAKSIISKCSNVDQTRIIGGTFHGLANSFIRRNNVRWNICDEGKKRLIIKKLFDCKKDKEKFNEILDKINNDKSKWPSKPSENTILYNQELKKYNLTDFDDMIYKFIIDCETLCFPKITHILVDELQDTSGPQLEMLKQLQKRLKCNMIGVADDDQCQPVGTKVQTITGEKNIEDLNFVSDRLLSYSMHDNLVYGKNNGGYIFNKADRNYNGNLIKLSTSNKSSRSTPNHKWIVKWSDEAKTKYITYLMKKGNWYRVGWCKLFNSENTFHFGTRIRLENADAGWILKTFNTKQEASYFESYVSSKYNVTLATFKSLGENTLYTQEFLDKLHTELEPITKSIVENKLFKDFNLEKEYPLWNKEIAYEKQGGTQKFIIRASNLIARLFKVLEYDNHKTPTWNLIENISLEPYNGLVYSLDVNNYETYISDGIVTHNCIYAWRGARPENVRDFIKVFGCTTLNMGYNFRSAKRIVESSSKLIEHNKTRIQKVIRPFKSDVGQVISYQTQSVFTEIDYVITKCRQYPDKEIAILYRNRTYKNHLEFELKKAKLEYCVNDSLDICDRSAIKVMLSCMRLASMTGDIYDLEIASKGIGGIGKTTVDKLRKEITKEKDLNDLLRAKFQDAKQANRLKSLISMANWFSLHKTATLDLLARHIETLFIKSFDYQEDMKNFILDITKCYKSNVTDIRDLCNDLGLDGKEEHNDENSTIELSTVHGYKGLARQIIIMPWAQMYDAAPNKDYNIEDERRLFYVGITRPEEKLFISYCGNKPRFIREMGI